MLFFFEFGVFALAIVAVALAELVGRLAALVFWGLVAASSLVARLLVGRRFAATPPAEAEAVKWRRAVIDAWRHFNLLLGLGLLALLAWWRLAG